MTIARYTTPPDHAALLAQVVAPAGDNKAHREALVKDHNDDAQNVLTRLTKSITQGEWLAFSRKIDIPRREIEADQNLILLAMAYFGDKRTHGTSSLDVLLDFTDEDLLAFHGFVADDTDDDQGAPPAAGEQE
jgi:hypothetical protein